MTTVVVTSITVCYFHRRTWRIHLTVDVRISTLISAPHCMVTWAQSGLQLGLDCSSSSTNVEIIQPVCGHRGSALWNTASVVFDVYHTVLGGMYDCSMSIILYLGAFDVYHTVLGGM